ncbi:uncharacterized protein EV154DRAFT_484572 [Mucor mucedo]|uniref:uncharacterized protein n=1 Tax=Mucor mucedo TaxID=29922 RepID=UPI00221FF08B|nr:uncharacterized protein EV154DRAFT_484572 [Mucor mucedo]KAI7887994.1 hypothetical protein EV154DRAFT_484572 [Mucor mucedo]
MEIYIETSYLKEFIFVPIIKPNNYLNYSKPMATTHTNPRKFFSVYGITILISSCNNFFLTLFLNMFCVTEGLNVSLIRIKISRGALLFVNEYSLKEIMRKFDHRSHCVLNNRTFTLLSNSRDVLQS